MENIQALNKALDDALALSDNLQKQSAELFDALYHVEKDIRDLHKALEDAEPADLQAGLAAAAAKPNGDLIW